MKVTPFKVSIAQEKLDDLAARLRNTRWAPEFAVPEWSRGVSGRYLRELTDYWLNGYDWRAQEARINALPQFIAEVDGIPIHYVHVKGKGPSPAPLVLNHGWPWTFMDFAKVVGPLSDPAAFGGDPADAFDVIVPSLPGFIFSGQSPQGDIGYTETARLWTKLMHGLGYERFGAHGGDAGAFVTARLGHAHAETMIGVHLALPVLPGWDRGPIAVEAFSPEERAMYEAQDFSGGLTTHLWVHTLEPQTLAWAMHDSPVGQAAWMLHRRRAWSDCGGDVERRFSKDELITSFALYWLSESFVTAIAAYGASRYIDPMKLAHERKPEIEAPTGFAVSPRELAHVPRSLAARHSNLRSWTIMPRGGHFAAAEEPELLVADLRQFFRPLRG